MNSKVITFVLVILSAGQALAGLTERWDSLQTKTRTTLELRVEDLQNHDFILVKGFLSQFIGHYFEDFENVLKNDFKILQVEVLAPRSEYPISYNSDLIYQSLLAQYKITKKPQIVVAHSKGAAEVLLALLFHPDLIQNKIVDKVISIQGAIDGSPIAVQTRKYCEEEKHWCYLFYEKYQLGFFTLEPDQIGHMLDVLIKGREAEFKNILDQHVFYVRTYQDKKQLDPRLSLIQSILGTSFAEQYDGLVPTKNQYRPEFGCDLAILDHVDHATLVAPKKTSDPVETFKRTTFVQALLEEVFSEKPFCRTKDSK